MERDKAIVRAVYQYRALSREQIQALIFPDIRPEVPQRRLKALYHHRYLERIPVPASDHPMASYKPVYRLARAGAELIAFEQEIELRSLLYWGKSDDKEGRTTDVGVLFLEHLLKMNDFRIAITLAAKRHGYQIEKWLDESTLRTFDDSVTITTENGRKEKVAVIPDGYFVLDIGNRRAHFLLEIDRATMTNSRWKQKIEAYQAYLQQGGYERRYNTRSLRVLTVTTSDERLTNL